MLAHVYELQNKEPVTNSELLTEFPFLACYVSDVVEPRRSRG